MVNMDRSEANREFDIQFVRQMTRGVFERNGFHIRLSVAPPDYTQFEATIPRDGLFPAEYQNRLVHIKGPSLSHWVKNTERYHKNLSCIQTKNAHNATEIEIQDDPSRELQYWLLVFPQHIVLDNQIFSVNDAEGVLPLVHNPITLKGSESGNEFGKDVRGMTLFWSIAVAGGRKIGKETTKAKAKDMFD